MIRTPDGLADVGRALHGDEWQAPLARDLGVSRESIRRWLNGSQPLPPAHGMWDDLAALAAAEAARGAQAAAEAARGAQARGQTLDDYARRIRLDAPR